MPARATTRHGFTLIQLLVVIGIIVLLIGLALPTLVRARKQAARTRTTADLALIGTALEAYKLDFGGYPQFTIQNSTDDGTNTPGNGKWLDDRTDRGAVLLCRCLLGPGPAGPVTQTYASGGDDGADGLGFRSNRTATNYGGSTPVAGTDKFTSKVYGPYIQSDKFPVGGTKEVNNFQDAVLLDSYGNPILYYAATPGHTTFASPNLYVAAAPPSSTAAAGPFPLYNAFDNSANNTGTPPYLTVTEMQYILGNHSNTGSIAAGETPVTTQPYLLWTAGPDGVYGRLTGKTDDVTNFDMPAELLK